MNINLIPSLLIPEVFHPLKREKNFTADVIEKVVEEDFYKSIELGDGFEKPERKRILELTELNGIEVTQWLTFLIEENNLDVSSLDSKLRLETVNQIKDSLYASAEIGAKNIALVTGDDPGADLWADGIEGLYESLCEIAEAGRAYNMNLLIEPLDRFAHKKRIIGTTDETVALLSRVQEKHDNVGIAFDTAHAALNGEDIFEALEKGKSLIHQIHFSNAVLDSNSELYGDFHMEIGSPGFLTTEKISAILRKADELKIQENGLRVAAEVRGKGNEESCFQNEKQLRTILQEALKLASN
ncbi:sugar phosphate isomerase/epimerase [Virgibacillus sp. NKC19-16]|uniref:sugar phosphate isomerase/epimerase family protein n=1 Tax=Virgibacillus salidurans TaxID=2831673 RepID=UPI001F30BD7B|nr:sugar phosphate isomerase/epimerase family protein [Virgibacillus sp. NKC19-16]UJL47420.1 sugar phosphate isomerase/epimerase [Virgibacillus sp. NKC19-16]